MSRPTGRRRLARGVALAGVAGLLATSAVIASAGAAAASNTLTVQYKVTGSTVIKKENATVKLGPGKLVSKVDLANGKLTASLVLPEATASFKQNGIIPVTATTKFIQDGKTTGTLNLDTGAVATTSKITLQIVSLSVAGVSMPVGPSCESASPASVKVASQKGFSIVNGGDLAGTYTIPSFANCGLVVTPLLNATIPGPGNTITLRLGKAKVI
jgi:hypothetical protein